MTKLGTAPLDTYYLSWMTQRLANRAPEFTHARRWSWSVLQQMLNPMARDMERVNKQLAEERNNIFMSAANMSLMDRLYYLELGVGMEFVALKEEDGVTIYQPPTVYATIDGDEYEISIATKNNVETLFYEAIPSRILYAEESYVYTEVVPRCTVEELVSVTPADLPIHGHLYVSIWGNTTWEYRGRNRIYYPKVYIRGTTRKGTDIEEAVPIRYNGTFKTINQWKSIEEVFVSYLDATAEISVAVMPFDRETQLDTRNILVPTTGSESWRFVRLEDAGWGSLLVSEGFTTSSFDDVRMGVDTLDYEYKIELHNAAGDPVVLTAMALKPNTDYFYAVDANNLYVYTAKLPYPDLTILERESPDTKMDLYSDRWIYSFGDTATIKTDILDVSTVPWRIRWTLQEPDGQKYYLKADSSKWPTTIDAWIDNEQWETGLWIERMIELQVEQTGVYILTLECLYSDVSKPYNDYTLTTRFLFYVPVLEPEVVLPLPVELRNATHIAFDSDDRLWFKVSGDLYAANIYHDYFLADYERKTIWLREDYTSARVVL
jgi:hypothetical protein